MIIQELTIQNFYHYDREIGLQLRSGNKSGINFTYFNTKKYRKNHYGAYNDRICSRYWGIPWLYETMQCPQCQN